ncbi:MAG: RNA polymerase sigma-70 factor [Sphingobacteriia bacterium]|nr:RNA polymerase sigma-70 factor [Sphingobacteriia bacterium]
MHNYHSYADPALLQQIAQGEQAAFNILFERHRAKLYDYLFDITKSREIAEELLMDVFLKIWYGRELAPQIQNVDAFLARIARNKAINFLTTTARRKHLQKLVAYGMAEHVENPAEQVLAEKEYQQFLREALDQLSPQRRLVFTLSREQGMNHSEIASTLQLSRQTVKNHMTEALKSIREFLVTQKGQHGLLVAILFFTK